MEVKSKLACSHGKNGQSETKSRCWIGFDDYSVHRLIGWTVYIFSFHFPHHIIYCCWSTESYNYFYFLFFTYSMCFWCVNMPRLAHLSSLCLFLKFIWNLTLLNLWWIWQYIWLHTGTMDVLLHLHFFTFKFNQWTGRKTSTLDL